MDITVQVQIVIAMIPSICSTEDAVDKAGGVIEPSTTIPISTQTANQMVNFIEDMTGTVEEIIMRGLPVMTDIGIPMNLLSTTADNLHILLKVKDLCASRETGLTLLR
jgi:hypothetical protein